MVAHLGVVVVEGADLEGEVVVQILYVVTKWLFASPACTWSTFVMYTRRTKSARSLSSKTFLWLEPSSAKNLKRASEGNRRVCAVRGDQI